MDVHHEPERARQPELAGGIVLVRSDRLLGDVRAAAPEPRHLLGDPLTGVGHQVP